jgi:hypothetical protein
VMKYWSDGIRAGAREPFRPALMTCPLLERWSIR